VPADWSSVKRLLNRFKAWIGVVDSILNSRALSGVGAIEGAEYGFGFTANLVRINHSPQPVALIRFRPAQIRSIRPR
jgi:hypothetical protein